LLEVQASKSGGRKLEIRIKALIPLDTILGELYLRQGRDEEREREKRVNESERFNSLIIFLELASEQQLKYTGKRGQKLTAC